MAATHRDLEREVAQQRFRRDLYYRINVIDVEIPPLRERREGIPCGTATNSAAGVTCSVTRRRREPIGRALEYASAHAPSPARESFRRSR